MKLFIILTILSLKQTSARGIHHCLEIIAQNCFNRGVISIFHSVNSSSSPAFHYLTPLMQLQKWRFLIYTETTKPTKLEEKKKQPEHEAVFLLYNNASSHNHFAQVLKTLRVLGPSTKIIIILGSNLTNIHKIMQRTWETLRPTYSHLVVEQNEQTLVYNFQPFSNTTDRKFCTKGLCPLNRDTGNFPIVAEISPDGEPYIEENSHHGICYQAIHALTTSMNLNLTVFSSKGHHKPLASIINGTWVYGGYFKELNNHEIDIICGAHSLSRQSLSVGDGLPPFIDERLVWVLPRPRRIAAWKNFLMALTSEVWIGTMGLEILIIIILYFYQKFYGQGRGFWLILTDVYGLLLGNALQKSQDYFRRILWLILMYSILFTSAYKAGLSVRLTIPQFEKQFSTLEEAAASGMNALLHHSMLDSFFFAFSSEFSTEAKILLKNNRFQVGGSIAERLSTVINQTNLMALMSSSQAEIAINRHFLNNDGSPKVDKLLYIHHTMHMHMAPGHPLYTKFYRKTLYMNEAGLIDFWLRDMKFKIKLKSLSKKTWDNQDKNGLINFNSLFGLFNILLLYLAISLMSFVLELITSKIGKTNFWTKLLKGTDKGNPNGVPSLSFDRLNHIESQSI